MCIFYFPIYCAQPLKNLGTTALTNYLHRSLTKTVFILFYSSCLYLVVSWELFSYRFTVQIFYFKFPRKLVYILLKFKSLVSKSLESSCYTLLSYILGTQSYCFVIVEIVVYVLGLPSFFLSFCFIDLFPIENFVYL